MNIPHKSILSDILFAVILYATVIIYQGYQYGQSDQSQILPVLYALDHPETYATDHYVQSYLKSGVNERSIFHALFRYMGYDHPWMVFFWHALTSISLIFAWIKIAGNFIKHKSMQWLSMAFILTIGFHTSTGSNELYYNQFIPSLPAKALASWGLYFWLKDKFTWWALLLTLATYIQPLAGLQLFILTSIALIINHHRKNILDTLPWKQMVIYILMIFPWIYLLAINNGGQQNPDTFMDLMEFRLSHHFFGSAFGYLHLFLGVLFALLVLIFYKDRLRWLFIIVSLGCILYEAGVEIVRSPLVLYSQWWKTTIWLEVFAFIAVVSLFEMSFPSLSKYYKSALLLPLFFLLLVSIYRFSGFREKPLFMTPISAIESDEVKISKLTQQLTPINSVFILPTDVTAFRWYSKRGVYVDYKALFHQEEFLKEWYERIQLIYDYTLENKRKGVLIGQHSKAILESPTPERIQAWKSAGITHIISTSTTLSFLPILARNKTYAIYKIP